MVCFFYKKHKSSYLVTTFYYVIDTVYIYSCKNLIQFWPILVMLCVKYIYISHVVFNLTIEWTPRVQGMGTWCIKWHQVALIQSIYLHFYGSISSCRQFPEEKDEKMNDGGRCALTNGGHACWGKINKWKCSIW